VAVRRTDDFHAEWLDDYSIVGDPLRLVLLVGYQTKSKVTSKKLRFFSKIVVYIRISCVEYIDGFW